MKKKIFQQIKLKHQIVLLVGSAIGAMLIFLIFYMLILGVNSRKDRSSYVESSVKQLVTELNNFDSDLNKVTLTLAYNRAVEEFSMSGDLGLRYMLSQDINLILESIQISNPRLDSMVFTDMDQVIIGTQEVEFFRLIKELGQEIQGEELSGDLNYYQVRDKMVCLSKSFYNHYTGTQYYIISRFNMDNIKSMLEGMQAFDKTVFQVMNREGEVIFSNQSSGVMLAEQMPKWDSAIEKYSDSGSWRVAGMALVTGISPSISGYINIMMVMMVFMSAALCGLGYLLYRGIASPVETVTRFMDQYGKFYNKQRLPISGSNEVAQISISVNRMLDEIQAMTKKIVHTQEQLYVAELAKKQAELTALQIQMNPHFLYNTLDCIRGIALVNKVPEVAEIATSMSKILRYSIKSEDMVLVEQETGSIEDYLKIIQIRHQNKYDISIEIEEEIKERRIPKMILQPLVENAVFYGLECKSGRGALHIEGRRIGQTLKFVVENTGKSISEEMVRELSNVFEENKKANSGHLFTERESIGLKNIDKRLKLLYGESFGIEIGKMAEGGTRVVVRVPVLEPVYK